MDINTARVNAKLTDYSGWELLARTFHTELPFTLYRKEDEAPAKKGRRRKAKSEPIDPKAHPDFTMFIASPFYGEHMNEQSLFLSVSDGWIEYHMRMPSPQRTPRQRANPPPANAVRGMV